MFTIDNFSKKNHLLSSLLVFQKVCLNINFFKRYFNWQVMYNLSYISFSFDCMQHLCLIRGSPLMLSRCFRKFQKKDGRADPCTTIFEMLREFFKIPCKILKYDANCCKKRPQILKDRPFFRKVLARIAFWFFRDEFSPRKMFQEMDSSWNISFCQTYQN